MGIFTAPPPRDTGLPLRIQTHRSLFLLDSLAAEALALRVVAGKLWCAKKNKRKRKKLLYNGHKNDGTTLLTIHSHCAFSSLIAM